jgi:hypothetical protein
MPEDRSQPPWTQRDASSDWFEPRDRGPAIAGLGLLLTMGGAAAFLRYLWTFTHECAPEYEPGIGCYGKAPLVRASVVVVLGLVLSVTPLIRKILRRLSRKSHPPS